MVQSRITSFLHRRGARRRKGDPVSLPIVASTTFRLPGDPDVPHVYGRYGNPTVEETEDGIGLFEDAQVVLFPSGMAAIAALFYAHLRPGDRVLVHADGYYNARALLETHFAPLGIKILACPTARMAEANLSGIKMVLAETPSNPGLEVCDVERLSRNARAAGALLAVDNTTATPLCQRPLDIGADFSVMADTKAMAGHSDVLAGHVACRNPDLIAPIVSWRRLAGAIVSPFDAFLLHRGLATVELRIARANANALALAHALWACQGVTGLRYPGLPSDPAHKIARQQMTGYGPIVSFCLPSRDLAERFIGTHPQLTPATSFGGVHASAECRIRWGDPVPEGFIRLSCGIEPTAEFVSATLRTLDALKLPAV
ncbi:cystathionine gamma-lyase [Hyphomonas sp.]|uniref:cystathionine gamma-lyase n=1 Tax=Hyphomonas sp. TaxID=87 RepID=UPI003918AA5C